jgi:2-iminobutanoate/2-iminopropanoate deaminase
MSSEWNTTSDRAGAVWALLAALFAALLLVALVGCAGTPKAMGIPWWSQGTGEVVDADSASVATRPATDNTEASRHGDLLFVSGQIAADPVTLEIVGSDIQAQTRTAMNNVVRILESHGLTASNILSVTLYMQDTDDLRSADAVYASYFKRSLPARSVVRVHGLPGGSLIEIAVIAGK